MRSLLPTTYAQVVELAAEPERLAEIYPQLEKISVDYAVMEPVSQGQGTAHVVAVRLPITWHDVGGFAVSGRAVAPRRAGNARSGTQRGGRPADNLVINDSEDGRLVAVVGLADTVIVQTPQITVGLPDERGRAGEGVGRRGHRRSSDARTPEERRSVEVDTAPGLTRACPPDVRPRSARVRRSTGTSP